MEVADWSKMQRKVEINQQEPRDGAALVLADKSEQLLLLAASPRCWVKIRTGSFVFFSLPSFLPGSLQLLAPRREINVDP